MIEFATIADLHAAVRDGVIEESKLNIILDNDETTFRLGSYDECDVEGVRIKEAKGFYDIEPLYKLLFPLAQVTWM